MHILIIGGSGMLRELALRLNKEGHEVSVLGRNQKKLREVKDLAVNPGKLHLISSDYTNRDSFIKDIEQLIEQRPVQKVVAWFHRKGDQALQEMCDLFSKQRTEWEIIHVKGSRAGNPAHNFSPNTGLMCTFKQVILGHVMEKDHMRWLTHSEISAGVYEAMHSPRATSTVGRVDS
ncbi:short-chain dehydrogenase [Halobacillus sp. Marseille-Q1614]|uniref:short-chain dehydrogenase n=1 Tax=Halobacillus sp. Marseille-Q1614 TaxID=2709134 RepID=UPI0015707AE0|nr:short-chain dehydrogenase [Halobacillus sp. Marseille-Q1614]